MSGLCAVLPVRHCPLPPPPPDLTSLLETDEWHKRFRYFGASGSMLTFAVLYIPPFWTDYGWHLALIAAIIFSYCTAMFLLVLKHLDRKEKERQVEPELRSTGCCQENAWMLVLTVIMLSALVPMVSVFRTRWHDLGFVLYCSALSTGGCSLLIIVWDYEHKRDQDAKKRQRETLDRRALQQRPRI